MHPALAIPEILGEIFLTHMAVQIPTETSFITLNQGPEARWLFQKSPESGNLRALRRNLLNASLTCRVFAALALDGLWRYMDSIFPLLCCLSNFQFDTVSQSYIISGEITSQDWMAFDNYARRIHWISYCAGRDISQSVFEYLGQHRGSCILPNLRVFQLQDVPRPPRGAEIYLFAPPTLKIADIFQFHPIGHAAEQILHQFLIQITKYCPGLRHLRVSAHLSEICLQYVSMLSDLRILEFGGRYGPSRLGDTSVTETNFLVTYTMNNLVLLCMDVHGDQFTVSPTVIQELSRLESIELSGPISPIISILQNLPKHRIHYIKLTLDPETDQVIGGSSLHHSLFSELNFPALRVLEVVSCYDDSEDAPILTRDILLTLLECNRLERVLINFDNISDVYTEDEDLRRMALAWPNLTRLEFGYCLYGRYPASPTVFALEHFARHCPRLIHVTINADTNVQIPDCPPAYSHGLRSVYLHSPRRRAGDKDNMQPLARYLDSLFPRLKIPDRDMGERWNAIFECIASSQAARRRDVLGDELVDSHSSS
ncbi:hypothetical protein NEOLEDRAFT_1167351 [Neolentinus lepideus HHB14362 ss-1]|uniref:F-box domain-containing protein n=1 Tax=Neolentinus lepideus HHB14362 ss-1 TaxID=1314782 RepID=A0A165UYM4_9AGAM|nr:hypothetical protein NEOLEDRAFT_1167351 [Neolentinus lepideus HHB14362 ss-1]